MSSTDKKTVDIVIPTYNEEEQIEWSVNKLRDYCLQNLNNYKWKIIVADNASTDSTLDIAKNLAQAFKELDCIFIPKKGKGRAIMKAWGKGNSEICAFLDTDHSTDLKHLPRILDKISEDGFDIAVGSRNLPESVINSGLKRTIISKTYVILLKLLLKISLSDAQCGFKAASRKVIDEVFPLIKEDKWDRSKMSSAFFFDTEFLVIAAKLGKKIYEEAVEWKEDKGSTVRMVPDSMEQLKGLIRLRMKKPWEKV